jgi:hypothetical protein
MVSFVAPAFIWVSLAASFVIGLAAVMRMAGPAPEDDVSGVIRLPGQVTATIAILFALAALVFLTDLVRRGFSRGEGADAEAEGAAEAPRIPPWLRRVTQLLSILNFVILAYLLWRGVIPLGGLLSLRTGAGSATGFALPLTVPASASPVITWTFGILALAAGLGALALALWVALGERLAHGREGSAGEVPRAPLESAVEESLEELHSEPDARRAIVRCYARFERAAADSGVERKPWFTPMEFMREALNRLPIPRTAGPTLTGLFELARFSHHPLGARERDRALEALDEIRTAMEARDGDAGAR